MGISPESPTALFFIDNVENNSYVKLFQTFSKYSSISLLSYISITGNSFLKPQITSVRNLATYPE